MDTKPKVKIVKKADAVKMPVTVENAKTARVAAREMVSNVSGWVSEFKARKSEETKAAIEQLFPITPQPSES